MLPTSPINTFAFGILNGRNPRQDREIPIDRMAKDFSPPEIIVKRDKSPNPTIPVIAAISFEILKIGDKFKKNKILGLITLPGMLVQKITTKEPSDKQIEVALTALKRAI